MSMTLFNFRQPSDAGAWTLDCNLHQAILTSPEMCLKHTEFQNIVAIIIDEVQCISQWGGQFCLTYAQLEKL
jgi:superfamily II DNA helicase RecQ